MEQTIEQRPDTRLVVIDPIAAYLGKANSHRDADVRGLLAPLAQLAAKHGVAVLAVTHWNKNMVTLALYRIMGSIAFVAAARAVWVVVKDKNDPERRLLLPLKNNLAASLGGLAYRLEAKPGHDCPLVVWDTDPVEVSADEVLTDSSHEPTRRHQAGEWLRGVLVSSH